MMIHAHARRVKSAYDASFGRDVEIERETEKHSQQRRPERKSDSSKTIGWQNC